MSEMLRKDYHRAEALLTILGPVIGETPTVTINGLVYTGVAGVKADNTEFSLDTDNFAIATDLADSINADVRVGVTVSGASVVAEAVGMNVLLIGTPIDIATGVGVVLVGSMTTSSPFLKIAGLIDQGNEVMRQVTFMNSPYSPQATGLDRHPEKYVRMDSAGIDALTTNTTVYVGNQDGYVKTVTGAAPVTSIVITLPNEGKTGTVDTTFTKAQLLDSRNIFFEKK